MKDNFISIPDFPNYEINSQLVVRNKLTGRLLKPYTDTRNNRTIVNLFIDGKRTTRSIALLRKLAVECSVNYNSFVPIYSAPLYEINRNGTVRNRRTKKILKPFRGSVNTFNLYITDGKRTIRRSISSLLFETFDITPKNYRPHVPLFISKGNQRFYFNNLSDAASFLAPRLFLSFHSVYYYFRKRKADIYGWHINYQL